MLNVLGNLMHAASEAVHNWRIRQRAYAELSALDDRSLADIGITRSEIPYVLSHAAADRRATETPVPANGNYQHAA